MTWLVSVLSQLFWGVTVGALTAAATLIGQAVLVGCGVAGAGCAAHHWRKRRALRKNKGD